MSDITIYGLVAAVAALATLAIGLMGVLIMGFVALVATVPEDDRRSLRVRRWVAGPFACFVLGVVIVAVISTANGGGKFLDDIAIGFPLAGVGLWVGVALLVRRRHRERSR